MRKHYSKYSFNKKTFDILSPSSAYVIGIFLSDGNNLLTKRDYRVSITSKDYEILEIVKKTLDSNAPIKEDKVKKVYYFSVHSKFLSFLLKDKFGIIPRKTYTVRLPLNIPSILVPHLMRGVMDGDGSNQDKKGKHGSNFIHTSVSSRSKLFIDDISNEINTYVFGEGAKKISTKSYWTKNNGERKKQYYIGLTGIRAIDFLDWIYQNSEGIRLERKYKIYQDHLKDVRNQYYNYYGEYDKISQSFGVMGEQINQLREGKHLCGNRIEDTLPEIISPIISAYVNNFSLHKISVLSTLSKRIIKRILETYDPTINFGILKKRHRNYENSYIYKTHKHITENNLLEAQACVQ